MKPRNTLFLFLVAAALLAFVVFCESRLPTTRQRLEDAAHLLVFDAETVNGIIIQNNDQRLELRRKDTAWYLEKPVVDRADDQLVARILDTAQTLPREATIDLPEKTDDKTRSQLKRYGLARPRVRLKFLGPDKPPELFFGKNAAITGRVYARRSDRHDVLAVPSQLRDLITQSVDTFRDPRLAALEPSLITALHIKTPAGDIEMARTGEHWELLRPLKTHGDDAKINALLAQLCNTRIQAFVTETTASPTGLGQPRGTVTLSSDTLPKPAVLEIGQRDEHNPALVYARYSARDAFYKLPRDIEQFLELTPNKVRDRHLGRLNPDFVDCIRLEASGQPSVFLRRTGEDWLLVEENGSPRPADRNQALRLLDVFQQEQAVEFVEDAPTDTARYGLKPPALRVTFSSYSSDNTAESMAGERPFLKALFGKTEGDRVFAMVEEEPLSVVAVRRAFVSTIATHPIQWRDPQVLKMPAHHITAIEIVQRGNAPRRFVRHANNGWITENNGPPPVQNAVESIAATLANLRAVRWVGPTAPEHGLADPALVVTCTRAGQPPLRLLLGTRDTEGMWFARIDGQEGVFLVSRPDAEVLCAELTNP